MQPHICMDIGTLARAEHDVCSVVAAFKQDTRAKNSKKNASDQKKRKAADKRAPAQAGKRVGRCSSTDGKSEVKVVWQLFVVRL